MKYAGESDTAKLNDSVGRYNIDTLGAYRANADKATSDRAVTNANLRTAGQQAGVMKVTLCLIVLWVVAQPESPALKLVASSSESS